MEKSTGKRGRYRKDFAGWAKVAEEIDRRERPEYVKVGAVFWCNIGIGIGSEIVGKGEEFTRPVLVLAIIDRTSILVVPTTTQPQAGGHYIPIILNGKSETLALHQARILDNLRLGDFIDELSYQSVSDIKRRYIKLLKRWLYKES